jgi:F-type H+-transporting ATPase subunit delta
MKATRQARREAKELFRVCLVNGLLDETRVRQAVAQLIETKPRGYLGTLSAFRRLVTLNSEEHTARIESAAPLSPELQAKLKNSLIQVYGPGLNTSFLDNPALIGGVRIHVGSDVYDGTVKGRLAALEQSF